MKVIGSFNDVSDELKQELIPVVKPNTVLNFQLINGQFDPVLKREVFGASVSIPLKDRIWDKYQRNKKGEVVGGYVDIGVPLEWKGTDVIRCGKFWVEALANGIPGNGQFTLLSSSIKDMEIFEFLCLTNFNGKNPHRDNSIAPKFENVDVDGNRKAAKEKEVKELRARLMLLSKENPEEAEKIVATIQPKKVEKIDLSEKK